MTELEPDRSPRRVMALRHITVGVAAAIAVAPATAQLIEQHVEGNRRACLYSPSGLPARIQQAGPGGHAPAIDLDAPRQLRIDARQACPATYDERADRISVPSLARLVGQERKNGQLTCYYRYLQKTYIENKGATLAPCPATPGAW